MSGLKGLAQRLLRTTGYELRRIPEGGHSFPPDFDEATQAIIRVVRPFTMTSDEALSAMIEATRHVVRHSIPGSFVECGVWRGGSMMSTAMALRERGELSRRLYLFDTFEGMTAPGEQDRSELSGDARSEFKRHQLTEDSSDWCRSPISEVRKNIEETGYPVDRVTLVKGTVEQTLPGSYDGGAIALLRLDTDWYQSTRHELVHLYPLLSPGGILIIDDYGHWEGARKACDEYFAETKARVFLHRVDYTVRLVVKP
jgi:hypothetical protein